MSTGNEVEQPKEEKQVPPEQLNQAPTQEELISNMDLLMDISLKVTVELGRTRMTFHQVLELQNGSVVELDRLAGDPVDIFVNDRIIARGEVVVVDDKFGVRITELISPANGAKS
jgi:flagellar motor switch protein FliN/FliY